MIERLFTLLNEKNITAKTLADNIGVSPGNVTDWKKGRSRPSADAIGKIASYLKVTSDFLLGLTDDPTPAPKQPELDERASEILDIYNGATELTKESLYRQARVLKAEEELRDQQTYLNEIAAKGGKTLTWIERPEEE